MSRLVVCCLPGLVFGMSTETAAQQSFVVDSAPVVDIRGTSASGDLLFGMATAATRLPSGAIAIADGSTLTVRFFSPTGQPTRSVGRSGQGPGEFRSMQWMESCGADSVYVWDGAAQSMSVIAGSGGEVARRFRIPAADTPAPRAYLLGCSAQRTFGYLAAPTTREPTGAPNIIRGPMPLVLTDADGKLIRQIGPVIGGEMAAMGGAGFPRPLGKTTSFALAGDRVYVGSADSAALDVHLPDGSTRTVRFTGTARAATSAHMEAAIETLAGMAPPQARERATASLRALEMPKTLPPYGALLTDPDGLVWVVESFPGDPATTLRAIGPTGSIAGEMRIPRGLRVFEIGRDYVLGGYADEGDEPHVAVYRVRRR